MIYLSLIILAVSWLVQMRLKSKFEKYAQMPFRGNLTGAELAYRMLRENGINDVKVISVEGKLTDHYNPVDRTVNLSPDVYGGRSVAAAAVAAHECGHAVQHATAYSWLTMRSKLVPAVSFASNWVQWIILAGFLLMSLKGLFGFYVVIFGVGLFALTTLFAFITLPVEYDASNRALVWLERTGLTSSQEHEMAKDALNSAAMTYVVAALGSLAQLLYYVMMLMGRRRDD